MNYSFDNSLENIASKFPYQYASALQVQSFLKREEYLLTRIKKALRKYEVDTLKLQEQHDKKSRSLQSILKHIALTQQTLDQELSDELHTEFNEVLESKKEEQVEVKAWMIKHNANDLISEKINYEINKVHYDFRKAVSERMAEWFATGAAGPGTVNFMGKEYKA